MAHPELPAEQAHVDHAYARLEAMRAAVAGMLAEAFGERGGTFQSFTERDIRVRTSLSRLEQLQIGDEALVFGRIDRAGGETFHIGRLAVSDEHQEPMVVDWRAPVVEPFYRATGAHPMGLRRRRHFLTEGRHLLDLEDELFATGDPADDGDGDDPDGAAVGLGLAGSQVLLAALNRARTGRMRDIVATVQREQDEIIRSPLSGVQVVQGGPGTGKTAVALHRAAYLLYTHRFPLETQGVLVVGPNPTYLRYIGHVLPSLGESGVELSTITGLYNHVRPSAVDSPAATRLKGDPRMAGVIARAVADRQRGLRRTVEIPYGRAHLRLSPEASAAIVAAAKRRPGTHNARRRTVETLLWRHLLEEVERRITPVAPPDGITALDEPPDAEPLTAAELGADLRRTPEVATALDRMWPLLSAEDLLHDLFGAEPLIELAARSLLGPDERALLHRPRAATAAEVAWTPADIPLLDEARALLGPPRRKPRPDDPDDIRTFGHIVVDEAQDLSPMQLRMLSRRSLGASMTIVGDVAQSTGPWAPKDWGEVVAHLPTERGWRQVELSVNYRTPVEIMEVAARVLAAVAPDLAAPEAVRATGDPLLVVAAETTSGLADAVLTTARRELVAVAGGPGGDGTLAVIAPPSHLDELAAALRGAGLDAGTGRDADLDGQVVLLAVDEAKGLEFDAVVVVEPATMVEQSAQGLRSVYVALTRATRRAAVVHARPLPEPLSVVPVAP